MKLAWGFAAICAAAMPVVHAAEAGRIDRVGGEQLADLLAEAGYRATVGRDGEGDPMVSSSAAGANFSIYMYGCEDESCNSLQFIAGFDLADGIALQRINAWNRDKRYGSAYLDDEDDPWLQMDLDLEGGSSTGQLTEYVELWDTLLGQFQTFIQAPK
jgi:hypothetical protein